MRPIYAASLEAHLNSTSTDLLDACVAKLRGGAGSSSEAGVMMDCAEDLLNLLMTVPATAPVGAAHRPGEAQLWQLELEIQNLKRRVDEAQLCAFNAAQDARSAALVHELMILLKEDECASNLMDMTKNVAKMKLKLSEQHSTWKAKEKEWKSVRLDMEDDAAHAETERLRGLRAQDEELKPRLQKFEAGRIAAQREAQELHERNMELEGTLSALRTARVSGLIEANTILLGTVQQLSTRRKANQRKIGDYNLEKHRTELATQRATAAEAALGEYYVDDGRNVFDAADLTLCLESKNERLELEVQMLKRTIKAIEDTEVKPLAAIVAPESPMNAGAFDAGMRFMIMKLIGMANVCPTRVPLCYKIVSDYHGIILPGRDRSVLVNMSEGVRVYKKTYIQWIPSETTCLRVRTEMGAFSQLQVGEYIIENGGTAGNFAVHSDAATSDGTELSAFVLGHRYNAPNGASKIQNLLLDLNWAMDKTSATRAADFRTACNTCARLCDAAGMQTTKLIAELIPSGSMNDRASPERLAAKMMTHRETDGPTCGEHGALVNPMHAGTKAMDEIVRGWMGKTDEQVALDEDKSRALHMAIGWHSSPCGAVIYATTKCVSCTPPLPSVSLF